MNNRSTSRPGTHPKGFSLIELLIVVSIILIIAAIAIPNLLRSRMAANESSAVANLRVLNNAEVTYAMTYNSGYTAGLNVLGPPPAGTQSSATAADLTDQTLAGMTALGTNTTFMKSGYNFTYTPTGTFPAVISYSVNADPQKRGVSGQKSFFTNEPLVIRSNSNGVATSSDNPI